MAGPRGFEPLTSGSAGPTIYFTSLHGSQPSHAISNDRNQLCRSLTEIIDRIYVAPYSSMCVVENGKLCTVLKKIGVRFVPVSYGVSEKIFVSLEDMGFSKILNLVDTEFSWIQKSFSIRVGQRL